MVWAGNSVRNTTPSLRRPRGRSGRRRQKKGAFARSQLLQTRFELSVLKGVLFLLFQWLVCATGHRTDFAKVHADAPEKSPDLGWRAPNAGELFNCRLRFGYGARWMRAEVRLERG